MGQSRAAEEVLALLVDQASSVRRDEMGPRYGIHTRHALGVAMADMTRVARQFDRSHELAAALWDTKVYEARIVAAMLDEPARVTPAQMDRWCADFDNWAICDTVCFNLFDRVRSLALPDKAADDARLVHLESRRARSIGRDALRELG